MIKVGIVGGTGYTGVELLRLLAAHPQVEIAAITSRGEAGTPVARMFPSLRGRVDLAFTDPAKSSLEKCDCVFFATPNGVAMSQARAVLDGGARIVDFSADFRLKDRATWEKWYKVAHASPELFGQAVYGLPEINREKIRGARLVANPGCYATAVQLALLPLVETEFVDHAHLIADGKSGVSGAGRKAELGIIVRGGLGQLQGLRGAWPPPPPGDPREPAEPRGRLGPQARSHVRPPPHADGPRHPCHGLCTHHPRDGLPGALRAALQGRAVSSTCCRRAASPKRAGCAARTTCRIAVHRPMDADTLVVLAVEDNLVKGAAGQAVQNMNLMFGFPETTAIDQIGAAAMRGIARRLRSSFGIRSSRMTIRSHTSWYVRWLVNLLDDGGGGRRGLVAGGEQLPHHRLRFRRGAPADRHARRGEPRAQARAREAHAAGSTTATASCRSRRPRSRSSRAPLPSCRTRTPR